MRLKKRIWALLLTLVIAAVGALAWLRPPVTAAESGSECRYYYQLVPVETVSVSRIWSLYVQRTDKDAAGLHGGTIALAAPVKEGDGNITFTPAAGWALEPGCQAAGPVTEGETSPRYLSFGWYWETRGTPVPVSSAETPEDSALTDAERLEKYGAGGSEMRQFLGTVTFPNYVTVDDISLLPWPDTPLGAGQLKAWQDAVTAGGDSEALMELLQRVWRCDDWEVPDDGWYQGYYAGTEGDQTQVDIGNAWVRFRVTAWAPERDFTVTATPADGGAGTTLTVPSGQTGTGLFTAALDLSGFAALPEGTYTLTITKQSHVTATCEGVTVGPDILFPELLGQHLYLPCGDIAELSERPDGRLLGDGTVKEADRVTLLSFLHRDLAGDDPLALYADLDGDGHVSTADLDILMAPGNWNGRDIRLTFQAGEGESE